MSLGIGTLYPSFWLSTTSFTSSEYKSVIGAGDACYHQLSYKMLFHLSSAGLICKICVNKTFVKFCKIDFFEDEYNLSL